MHKHPGCSEVANFSWKPRRRLLLADPHGCMGNIPARDSFPQVDVRPCELEATHRRHEGDVGSATGYLSFSCSERGQFG